MEFMRRSISKRELEDVLRTWRQLAARPNTAALIRNKLGIVASSLDEELESAMNDLVICWKDQQPACNPLLPSAGLHTGDMPGKKATPPP